MFLLISVFMIDDRRMFLGLSGAAPYCSSHNAKISLEHSLEMTGPEITLSPP